MTLLQFLHENSEIHSHLSSRIRVGILGKVHITSPFCYFVCCRCSLKVYCSLDARRKNVMKHNALKMGKIVQTKVLLSINVYMHSPYLATTAFFLHSKKGFEKR